MRRAAAVLDAADRAAFLRLLRAEGQAVRPANRQARALRLQAWNSLAEPNVDAATAKEKLARARTLNQESRASVEDAVVDFASALPVDQRAALGRALRPAIQPNGGGTNRRSPPIRHP